ncbi:uncharacterized protein FTJAE_8314 [Fusarium tjaetaba]|uniref:Uncharacterized protein n=1 Tax=Fusarium tjaetaba TaxID=1567544 RepID=A0A8H5RC70_9HYPO|nr:uncharacterized protein FTJAE_8314 [Fusarium tjaetaba]KAF5630163.1 hypothetical protein FTJAE_8314 [Fusarium tjaetaba]
MTTPQVSQADANLWLAYGVKLKNTFAQSCIAAGKGVDSAITNLGLHVIGDTLLSLDEPFFLPGRQSYFQRCVSYSNSIELRSDKNTGAQVRYDDAREKFEKVTKYYTETRNAAQVAWLQEKNAGFTTDLLDKWSLQNYPQLEMAHKFMTAAARLSAAASTAMDGPMASIVGRYQTTLTVANGTAAIHGLTMTCSPASADQIAAGLAGAPIAPFERPAYTISAQ